MDLKDVEKLKYDIRMTEINLKARVLTEDEIKKQSEKLEDCSSMCEKVDFEHETATNSHQ